MLLVSACHGVGGLPHAAADMLIAAMTHGFHAAAATAAAAE